MSPSVEHALQQHATAMRSLARALVGDQHADDVLQETALQALQRPPLRHGLLRGWLVAILRHMASNQRRAQRRRAKHEAEAPLPTPEGTPAEAAEHRDTLRLLTAVLTALPEPYQGTLLLRFFEDLPPAVIAAKTGVPVATVKSRLQRGLSMLRERLGADGRDDWRPALGAAFGLGTIGKTTAAATVAVTGVLLMSTGAKLALSGVAALLALAAWWMFGSAAAPEQQPVASAPAAAAGPASADLGARTPASSERRDVTPPSPEVAASDLASVRGRCVDESGRPLPRCDVELRGSKTADGGKVDHARDYGQWLVAHPGGGWRNLQTATGDDGRFEFAFTAPPLDYELRLRRDVLDQLQAVGTVEPNTPRDVGDIVLPVSCRVIGRVVDTDGAPVANTAVDLWTEAAAGARQRPTASTDTGGDGSFEARVVAGHYNVRVAYRKVVRGGMVQVAAAVEQVDLEVVIATVAATDTITGIVVDPQGAAVAGATVQAINQNGSKARTDANGHFCLSRPTGQGESVMMVASKDDRHSDWRSCTWGMHDLRLVLDGEPGTSIELRVTTTDGTPVTDFAVRGFPPRLVYNMVQTPPDGPHDGGIATLSDVPRALRFLLVEPDRWDLWNSGFLALPAPRDASARMVIELPAASERTLRVLRGDATPAEGIAVELLDPAFAPASLGATATTLQAIDGPDFKGNGEGYRQLVLQLQRGVTDANGELRLHGPATRSLALRLPGPGHAPMLVDEVRLDARQPLVVTLPPSARLDGRLLPDALVRELRQACGLPADGPAPTERSRTKDQGFRLRRGHGADAELVPPAPEPGVLPDRDGNFTIDGVPPGTWELVLARWDDDGVALDQLETVATVDLHAGHSTPVTVELPGWVTATVEAQVLGNGVPFARQRIELRLDDGGHGVSKTLSTDADGRFELNLRQGTLRISVSQMVQRWNLVTFDAIRAREGVFVQGGQRVAQVFHLDTCKLRLRAMDADGRPVPGVGLYLRSDDGLLHKTSNSDADGNLAIDVEPGTFTVLAMPQRLRDADRKLFGNVWTVAAPDPLALNLVIAGSVTAKAGETVEADVHLPPEWFR